MAVPTITKGYAGMAACKKCEKEIKEGDWCIGYSDLYYGTNVRRYAHIECVETETEPKYTIRDIVLSREVRNNGGN